MPGKFKHEEVSAVPRGYRTRTVRRGSHEIRVAFPPGRRRRGAGRVVSILHPVGENPNCPIRHIADSIANPEPCKCGSGEPAVFGGMCARCAREKARQARERAGQIRAARLNPSEEYRLRELEQAEAEYAKARKIYDSAKKGSSRWRQAAADLEFWGNKKAFLSHASGNPRRFQIKKSKTAPFGGGGPVWNLYEYDERGRRIWSSIGHPSKSSAQLAQRTRVSEVPRSGNPRELSVEEKHQLKIARDTLRMPDAMAGVMGAPTKKQAREIIRRLTRKNPDELAEAEDLYREFHGREPHEILEMQESELARRDYTALGPLVELHTELPNGSKAKISFGDADAVLVVSSPNGRQLYLLGGNQDISGSLASMGVDSSKELIDLGDAVFLSYDASKWQTDFKPTIWEHKLGEESGIRPRGFYDQLKRRIFFAGGNYRVERPGIID
jgi:hypothetical protein